MRRMPLAAGLAVLVLASQAAGSAEPAAVLRQSLEAHSRAVLENGLIAIVKQDQSAPLVSIQIWVGAGAMHEEQYLGAGLSHLLEHMIFKGTPARAAGEMAREINALGGTINAYTAHDRTVFLSDMPARQWRRGLEILADAAFNASFPEEELRLERDVILREMAMCRDDPGREASRLLFETAFREHPYRVPVIGYRDAFLALTREDLLAYFKKHFVPNNMIAVVVGDVEPEAAFAAVREVMGGYPRKARAPVVFPREPARVSPAFRVEKGRFTQSRMHWAYHTVPLDHADAPALDVLAAVAGEGRSSRLAAEIREKLRLVYSIDAWSFTGGAAGLFGVSALFEPEREAEVMAAVELELRRLSAAPVGADEIQKAKRMVLTSELGQLQSMSGQAFALASGEFYAGDPVFSAVYLERLGQVTPASLLDAARRYLGGEARAVVVLRPESFAAPAAEARAEAPAEVRRHVLPNKLTVLTREDRRTPLVHICVALGGGLLHEPADAAGIMRLAAEMMRRGAGRRSAAELDETVEKAGGALEPFSGYNSFGLQASCLSSDVELFAELAAQCLLEPSFPAGELEKLKAEQIAAIERQKDSPVYTAESAVRKALFGAHPYRCSPLGEEDSVARVTRQELRDFARNLAVTENAVVAVFGDVATQEAVELAERFFRKMPAGMKPAVLHAPPAPDLPVKIEKRERKEQTIYMAAFPGVRVNDPRLDALNVLETALSGLSSRLMAEIREKRGFAYFVDSFNQPGVDPGMFALYAGVREDALAETEALMDAEIKRLTAEGPAPEELERAKRMMLTRHNQALQSNAELAMECALNELYGLGYSHGLELESRLERVTAQSVRDAAASIMSPSVRAVAIVRPGPE